MRGAPQHLGRELFVTVRPEPQMRDGDRADEIAAIARDHADHLVGQGGGDDDVAANVVDRG